MAMSTIELCYEQATGMIGKSQTTHNACIFEYAEQRGYQRISGPFPVRAIAGQNRRRFWCRLLLVRQR